MSKIWLKIFVVLMTMLFIHNNAHSGSPIEDALFGGKSLQESMAEADRVKLKGIDDVYIVIESLSDSAVNLGINRNTIKTAVEIKLRRAGVKVSKKDLSLCFM